MIFAEAVEFLRRNLPAAPEVKQIVINPSFSGVLLENRAMGISMNVRKGSGYNNARLNDLFKKQIGKDGLTAVSNLSEIDDHVARSIKLALINALAQPFMTDDYLRQHGYNVESGENKKSGWNIKSADTVVIVGFGGNVRGVSQKAGKVFVTELEPDMFRSTIISENSVTKGPFRSEIVHASDAEEAFKKADVVMLTGCSLVTRTMEDVLEQSKGKKIIVYGHSAAFFPEPLFKRGVSVVATRRITRPELMVELLSECSGMVERFFPEASEELKITKP